MVFVLNSSSIFRSDNFLPAASIIITTYYVLKILLICVHLFRCLPFPRCAAFLLPVFFGFLSTCLFACVGGESHWPDKNIEGSDMEFWVFNLTKLSTSSSLMGGHERLSPRGVDGAESDTGFLFAVICGRFSVECERERCSTGVESPVESFSWTVWSTALVSSISMASVASSIDLDRKVVLTAGGDCSKTLASASAWEVVRRPCPCIGDKHCSGVAIAPTSEAWTESCDVSPDDCACAWSDACRSNSSSVGSVRESVGDSSCPGPRLT